MNKITVDFSGARPLHHIAVPRTGVLVSTHSVVVRVHIDSIGASSKCHELLEVVRARIIRPHSAGAMTCYAYIWMYLPAAATRDDRSVHLYGAGKATGYGYHRASAALADAISTLGVRLSVDISGRGDGAMREAMEAIAAAAMQEYALPAPDAGTATPACPAEMLYIKHEA